VGPDLYITLITLYLLCGTNPAVQYNATTASVGRIVVYNSHHPLLCCTLLSPPHSSCWRAAVCYDDSYLHLPSVLHSLLHSDNLDV
jgi:hypothetical protein